MYSAGLGRVPYSRKPIYRGATAPKQMATRDTQLRIIRTAIALFNEYGTSAVSTNRIAEECGISKGNLHYHFRNKQEIIQCIFRRIVDEMNGGWYRDHLEPTLHHLAEMFARQLLLIFNYRFFYREMPNLLRSDPLLLRRYQENRRKRMRALEEFFIELDKHDMLNLRGDRRLINSLVHSTWIISDNWLNSIELLGQKVSERSILEGYDRLLDILHPYLPAKETDVTRVSYAAIRRHVKFHGFALN